jgi:peptidoglycan hydrolase-like protein with peptidoglycan-binding domain
MKMISLIAVALALSLAWTGVALPQTTTEKAKDKAEDVKDKAEDKADKAGDKAESTTEKAKDTMKAAGEKVKDRLAAENVRASQQALKAKGFDPGPIDGIMGPRTAAAVRDFQQQQGLKATGQLDMATRSQLGSNLPATDPARTDARSEARPDSSPSASPAGEMKSRRQSP